jgi:CspA family cold shock protein
MQNGSLKFYSDTRNFGFIKPEAGADLFVHGGAFVEHDKAKPGDRVRFEIGTSKNGQRAAVNVRLIDASEAAAEAVFRKADAVWR